VTNAANDCVPVTFSSTAPNDVDAGTINRLLERHLETELPRYFGHTAEIEALRWEAIDMQTSFAVHILQVHLTSGDTLKLFVKDFSSSILPKDGLEQRSERERRVYRELLAQQDLGTAHYFGTVAKPGQTGFYLLLEFVEGMWLKYRDFDDWVSAAGWLGMLHGTFMNRQDDLAAADFLIRHDAGFFREKAETALTAVSQFSEDYADQLTSVLDGYSRLIDIMVSQPATLVHGSFRVQNILVTNTGLATRICPVDWELAATGGGLCDLAFIAHGYAPDKAEILLNAYRTQLSQHCTLAADKTEMAYAVQCYLLHKVVKSLSDSIVLDFSDDVVRKYIDMAIAIRRTLDKH